MSKVTDGISESLRPRGATSAPPGVSEARKDPAGGLGDMRRGATSREESA